MYLGWENKWDDSKNKHLSGHDPRGEIILATTSKLKQGNQNAQPNWRSH